MTVSGGIKFLKKSRCHIDNENVLVTCSTGAPQRTNLIDNVTYTKWQSSGSDDLTTETIEIDFGASYTIDRLILRKNNFKAFTVQYDNSGWTHFANVVTKEGSQANITETTNTKETNYYEFDSVTTQKILISVDTTQSADDEKECYEVIASEEIGTLTGYPVYQQNFQRKTAKKETPRGRSKFSIFDEIYNCTLTFSGYPTAADHTIMLALWDLMQEFYIYPCGANEDQFRFEQKGYRLEDIYLVHFDGEFGPNYVQNVYVLGLDYTVNLTEVL